jgi:hypothetical protein
MIDSMNLDLPVYIDGPCNAFWETYYTGPNSAFLVRTDGVLFAKHGWFNQPPANMMNDINLLLGYDTIEYGNTGGSFTWELQGDSVKYGLPGETITLEGKIFSNDTVPVLVEVIKLLKAMPEDWASSFCTDVCYSPFSDTIEVYVAPNTTQSFKLYFYTGTEMDSGTIKVGFRNVDDYSENVVQFFTAITDTGLEDEPEIEFQIIPTIVTQGIMVTLPLPTDGNRERIHIYDLQGRHILTSEPEQSQVYIDVSLFQAGCYLIRTGDRVGRFIKVNQ